MGLPLISSVAIELVAMALPQPAQISVYTKSRHSLLFIAHQRVGVCMRRLLRFSRRRATLYAASFR